MIALVACSALLMAAPVPDAPPADVDQAYQEAKAQAGRSSVDQVRLALWCEAHGLTAERLNHLALAVLADPANATARGLMGLVAHDGRFQRPEAVAEKTQAQPILAEYDARRAVAPYTADGQWAMGVWADDHGLKDQARAHFTAVTRLDPNREHAWKRLGYKKHDGRWRTDAQANAEKAEADAQKLADARWKPILEDWRRRLAYPSERAKAEAGLAGVDDPRAVPMIVRVFGGVGAEQLRAVQLLGQVDAPSSSRALAILAVAARSGQARRSATETLRGRDPREYADILIGLLREPIRFEVKHVDGPSSPGVLLIEGKRANLRRVYTPPSAFQAGDRMGFNASGQAVVFRQIEPGGTAVTRAGALFGDPSLNATLPVGSSVLRNEGEIRDAIALVMVGDPNRVSNPLLPTTQLRFRFGDTAEIPLGQMVQEVRRSTEEAERQLREDVQFLEGYNVEVRIGNLRASSVLNDATGQSLAADRRAWTGWYVDQIGYASPSPEWTSRVARTEQISIAYQPPTLPENSRRQVLSYDRVDCFAAGTPVRTIAGPRPIETLKVGDRVLTQSTASGALSYHPVLATHENLALPTCRVRLGGESIVASHVHRFWVAGKGWALARDLKPGDPIRTLGGVTPVESVEPDVVRPVYNLDVAEDADFFAGSAAALVHDNTLPDPRLVPFDAAPTPVAARRIK